MSFEGKTIVRSLYGRGWHVVGADSREEAESWRARARRAAVLSDVRIRTGWRRVEGVAYILRCDREVEAAADFERLTGLHLCPAGHEPEDWILWPQTGWRFCPYCGAALHGEEES